MRRGPTSGPPLIERVIRIMNSDCHTAKVALIGHGNTLRYILATENLKVGDLVKTSSEIPKNPGRFPNVLLLIFSTILSFSSKSK
jgi:large subunit ribosomal protein L2